MRAVACTPSTAQSINQSVNQRFFIEFGPKQQTKNEAILANKEGVLHKEWSGVEWSGTAGVLYQ